jgi:hypothetical protein
VVGHLRNWVSITTYTFNAVQHSNGKTNGHLILHFRAAEGSMYVEIDCLRLFGANQATMSGVITKLYGNNIGAPPYIFLEDEFPLQFRIMVR